jgi:hypothetical protein
MIRHGILNYKQPIVASGGGGGGGWPTSGLVSRWALQSDLNDSVNSYNFSCVAGTETYSAGISGNALVLNGTNGFTAAHSGLANTFDSTNQWSISLWQKQTVTTTDVDYAFINVNDDGSNAAYITWHVSAQYANTCLMHATNCLFFPPYFNTSWHHVVILRDSTNIETYYDGDATRTGFAACSQDFGTTNFLEMNIGTGTYGSVPTGGIQFVYVYNRAITTTEIATLYNSGTGI